jgi:hypothetical protein
MDLRADVEEDGGRSGRPSRGRRPLGADPRLADAGTTIDERLETIAEKIRSWDWRSAIVNEGGGSERSDEAPSHVDRPAPNAAPLRLHAPTADHRGERTAPPPVGTPRMIPLPVERAREVSRPTGPERMRPPAAPQARVAPPSVAPSCPASPRVEQRRVVPPPPRRVVSPPVEQSRVIPPRVEHPRVFSPPAEQGRVASPPVAPPRVQPPPPPTPPRVVSPPVEQSRVVPPRVEHPRVVPPPAEQSRVASPPVAPPRVVPPPVAPPRAVPPPVEAQRVASPPPVAPPRVDPPTVAPGRAFTSIPEPTLLPPATRRDAPLSPAAWRWAHSTEIPSAGAAPRRTDSPLAAWSESATAVITRPAADDTTMVRGGGAVRRIDEPEAGPIGVEGAAAAGPPADADTDEDELPRRWGRVILWCVAAAVVVIAVALIRMNAPGSTSGSLTPTTVQPKTNAAPKALIAVSPSVKKAFVTASAPLKAANFAATQAMASSAGQSTAQVAQEVTPYAKALDTFAFDLHFITWPEAMQVPNVNLTVRVKDLSSFIATISSATPATLPTWESQFHALAAQTETSDNVIRKDIGLPSINGFP